MSRKLISKHLCISHHIGLNGNLFGGILLTWLDTAGYIYASELCSDSKLVTAHIDKISFKKAVKQGNIVYIYGELLKFGNTSITINVKAVKKNIDSGKEYIVCETNIVFVNIDNEGNPRIITSPKKDEFLKNNN